MPPLHPRLFDFQRALVEWSLLHGRTAIFADCGMGKTPMQLVWAREVARKARKPVLIIAPLAVTTQTVHEAVKFEIDAARSQDGTAIFPITVTNYERLHYFSPHDFAGCVCDESSILKSFDGATRNLITGFMLKMEFRLLCTATAAPNDYTGLGTSSEALGYLGHVDMLNRFFKNDQGNAVKTNRQWEGQSGASRATRGSTSGVGRVRGRVPCAVRPTSDSRMMVSTFRR